ncbi:unnamed protein product [Auanema sp. JU1783]|nr:unnamed protein product [Auanema sp. JU1783]
MLRFIRNSFNTLLDDHIQISEFFEYSKVDTIGYPSNVTAVAFDEVLNLFCVATCEGKISIFGQEKSLSCFLTESKDYVPRKIVFATGSGFAVIEASSRKEIKFFRLFVNASSVAVEEMQKDPRWKVTNAYSIAKNVDNKFVFLQGTQGGNISKTFLETLTCEEYTRCDEFGQFLRNAPIVQMAASPNLDKILITQKVEANIELDEESHHVLTMIDIKTQKIITESVLDISINIENVTWTIEDVICIQERSGNIIDLCVQNLRRNTETNTSNGFFSCFPNKGLRQVQYCYCKNKSDVMEKTLVFIGGVTETIFGDRNIVTLRSDSKTCSLELGSPVQSIEIAHESDADDKFASVLIILAKNELVFIDLRSECYRPYPTRFLYPLDAHDITCTQSLTAEMQLLTQLNEISKLSWCDDSKYSTRSHTFFSNILSNTTDTDIKYDNNQLVLTGFSDGSITITKPGIRNGTVLFQISTKYEYMEGFDFSSSVSNEECVSGCQFYKVGVYDTYSDEPGLEIASLEIDSHTGILAVGTKMGVVLIYRMNNEELTLVPESLHIMLCGKEIATHSKIKKIPTNLNTPRRTEFHYKAGYQPYSSENGKSFFAQLVPNTPIYSLSLLCHRNLVVAAAEFGFAVINYKANMIIFQRSFITLDDLSDVVMPNDTWSVFKSMKKSIRDTFRRRRRPRDEDQSVSVGEGRKQQTFEYPKEDAQSDMRPMERCVESRTVRREVYKPWLIRYSKFIKLPWTNGMTDVLFVGTNGGKLFCCSVAEEGHEVTMIQDKEIVLAHGAPIIDVDHFIDYSTKNGAVSRLLVVTQEQVRLFLIPSLKSTNYKIKLTCKEGLKNRKSRIVQLTHKNGTKLNFLMLLINNGEIRLYSLSNPGRNIRLPLSLENNHLAMEHAIMTSSGDFVYIRSGQSELQRVRIQAVKDNVSLFGV